MCLAYVCILVRHLTGARYSWLEFHARVGNRDKTPPLARPSLFQRARRSGLIGSTHGSTATGQCSPRGPLRWISAGCTNGPGVCVWVWSYEPIVHIIALRSAKPIVWNGHCYVVLRLHGWLHYSTLCVCVLYTLIMRSAMVICLWFIDIYIMRLSSMIVSGFDLLLAVSERPPISNGIFNVPFLLLYTAKMFPWKFHLALKIPF